MLLIHLLNLNRGKIGPRRRSSAATATPEATRKSKKPKRTMADKFSKRDMFVVLPVGGGWVRAIAGDELVTGNWYAAGSVVIEGEGGRET